MAEIRSANGFDVIVIGSGMGGMTTAAAPSAAVIDSRVYRHFQVMK